jgi:hypothetical protein
MASHHANQVNLTNAPITQIADLDWCEAALFSKPAFRCRSGTFEFGRSPSGYNDLRTERKVAAQEGIRI